MKLESLREALKSAIYTEACTLDFNNPHLKGYISVEQLKQILDDYAPNVDFDNRMWISRSYVEGLKSSSNPYQGESLLNFVVDQLRVPGKTVLQFEVG